MNVRIFYFFQYIFEQVQSLCDNKCCSKLRCKYKQNLNQMIFKNQRKIKKISFAMRCNLLYRTFSRVDMLHITIRHKEDYFWQTFLLDCSLILITILNKHSLQQQMEQPRPHFLFHSRKIQINFSLVTSVQHRQLNGLAPNRLPKLFKTCLQSKQHQDMYYLTITWQKQVQRAPFLVALFVGVFVQIGSNGRVCQLFTKMWREKSGHSHFESFFGNRVKMLVETFHRTQQWMCCFGNPNTRKGCRRCHLGWFKLRCSNSNNLEYST